MSEYMVDVGLNLQADNYITTMGQAINLTKQYANVAEGVPGAVQNMSKSMVNATMAVTGFNKVNNVAVDTAAQYEKQLSQIEATTKISGQSFDKLSKATKGWAREFPIGMNQAVEVMETLQKQGIKSEKQMTDLGKSMIKLGAATGTRPGALGEQMLQLSRTMGNGLNQFEKLSDSLITTTNKLGGSAPAVVAFSKAIAPVASTVGISQTAITGLSTAMSRLGEDGFMAANAFNKVLLDMNRSIRDGGPEMKAYADLLGTTSDRLRDLFKSNPTEVLSRFTEAVAKAGPDVSRTLDALGFDSVRTTRSLTGLARSGSLRESIDTAISGYGDGSTAKAAEAAMDGLTNQTERLRETMSQVVANVGTPMLGVAKGMLAPAQAVAEGAQSVTGSAAGQKFFGATGVLSAGGSMAGSLISVMTVAAVGKMALDFLSKTSMFKNFSAGFREARTPGFVGPQAPGAARGAGAGLGLILPGGGPAQFSTVGGNALTRFAGRGMELMSRYNYAVSNTMNTLPGGQGMGRLGVTPIMAGLRDDMRGNISNMRDAARTGDYRGASSALRGLAGNAALYARTTDVGALSGARNLAMSTAALTANAGFRAIGTAGAIGGAAMSGLGRVMSPQMMALMGAPLLGMGIYKAQKSDDDYNVGRFERNKDIYRFQNDFAEATGNAGKGIVDFGERIKETTRTLVQANTSFEDAFTLTNSELKNALSPGYKPTIDFTGDNRTAESFATQALSATGINPNAEQLSYIMSDAAHYFNGDQRKIKEVTDILKGYGGSGKQSGMGAPIESFIEQASSQQNTSWWGWTMGSEETQKALSQLAALNKSEAFEAGELYGGTITTESGDVIGAAQATQLIRAEEVAREAFKEFENNSGYFKAREGLQKNLFTSIAENYGLTLDEQQDAGLGVGFGDALAFDLAAPKSFEEFINADNEVSKRLREQYEALEKAGVTMDPETRAINYGSALNSERTEMQTSAENYLLGLSAATNGTQELTTAFEGLTKTLFSVENASRESGKSATELTRADVSAVGGNYAVVEFANNAGNQDLRQKAIDSILQEVLKDTGGDYRQAQYALTMTTTQAGVTATQKEALEGAIAQLGISQTVAMAGRSKFNDLYETYQTGQQAMMTPRTSSNTGVIQGMVDNGRLAMSSGLEQMADVNRAYGAMQVSMNAARRSAGVQIGSIARNARIGEARANEDYDLQEKYAGQDYRTNRRYAREDARLARTRATRDFQRSDAQGEEDKDRTIARANRDFATQMERADRDYNKQRARATEDFNTARERANRDYNKQVERSQRDFRLSESRAQEDFDRNQLRSIIDFNKSKARAQEDFNKQMSRASEDAARQMYDPFKRVQAQMVMDAGQLVANLGQQTKMMEDQTKNLAKARELGLSETSIKQLNLADSSNAQQLSRLVGDIGGNQDLAGQINEMVAAKDAAAQALFEDSGNTQRTRSLEDFATQLARMEDDFNTATARSNEDFQIQKQRSTVDFATQLADAQLDFATSMADGLADFNLQMDEQIGRMAQDYRTQVADATHDFGKQITDMIDDYDLNRKRSTENFIISMGDLQENLMIGLDRMEAEYEKSRKRAAEALERGIKRMREDAKNAMADVGASLGASLAAMEESFFGMFQQSETGLGAAKQFLEIVANSKIDVKDMSDEFQTMVKAAEAFVKGVATGSWRQKMSPEALKEFKGIGNFKAPQKDRPQNYPQGQAQGDDSESPSFGSSLWTGLTTDITTPEYTAAWNEVGSQIWNGVIDGIVSTMKINPITHIVQMMIDHFTGPDGTDSNSPSKKFIKIGGDIAEGLRLGIVGGIEAAWNTLTAPIANLDIGTKVENAFSTAKRWIETLDSKISNWVSTAWDNLTNSLPSLTGKGSIVEKVTDAFSTAKSWIENLGGSGKESIKSWIGDAWDNLMSNIPTLTQVANKVKAAFGLGPDAEAGSGIAGWLQGLKDDAEKGKDTVKGWIGNAWNNIIANIPGVENVRKAFSGLVRSIYGVVGSIIDAWNAIKIKIDIPDWAQKLPGPQNGKDSLSFGTTYANKPTVPEWAAALGGIATKQMTTLIGEAGYPEAVIPLNQRGAEVLAATMARYVDKTDVQAAGMERYASPVTNYYSNTQDYSTQFNGQITVQATNPDELAHKLQARARRQALAQPIRGQR
jgi:TP901 family phage tail tape measure protein